MLTLVDTVRGEQAGLELEFALPETAKVGDLLVALILRNALGADSGSGIGTPTSGEQWGTLNAKLATPAHHYGLQDTGSPLVDAIGGQNLAYTGGLGNAPEYNGDIPGWTRNGVKFPTQTLNPTLGYWTDAAIGGSLNTNDTTGAIIIFLLARQHVSSNPANVRKMLTFAGSDLVLGVGSAAGTDRKTRLNVGASSIVSTNEDHNDGAVHPFLIQAYEENGTTLRWSLDTDIYSGESSLSASFGSGTALELHMSEVSGDPNPANFDYLDCWIWRGQVLTAEERVALLEDLGWRGEATELELEVSAPSGWIQIEESLGGGSQKLDAWARLVERNEPTAPVFTSGLSQTFYGELLVLRGGSPGVVRESSATASFNDDATPTSPTVESQQAINLLVCAWWAVDSATLTVPGGFTEIDAIAGDPERLLFGYRIAKATGSIEIDPATASGAVTGRSFALVLRDRAPIPPTELFDPVPGNLGLLA